MYRDCRNVVDRIILTSRNMTCQYIYINPITKGLNLDKVTRYRVDGGSFYGKIINLVDQGNAVNDIYLDFTELCYRFFHDILVDRWINVK